MGQLEDLRSRINGSLNISSSYLPTPIHPAPLLEFAFPLFNVLPSSRDCQTAIFFPFLFLFSCLYHLDLKFAVICPRFIPSRIYPSIFPQYVTFPACLEQSRECLRLRIALDVLSWRSICALVMTGQSILEAEESRRSRSPLRQPAMKPFVQRVYAVVRCQHIMQMY